MAVRDVSIIAFSKSPDHHFDRSILELSCPHLVKGTFRMKDKGRFAISASNVRPAIEPDRGKHLRLHVAVALRSGAPLGR